MLPGKSAAHSLHDERRAQLLQDPLLGEDMFLLLRVNDVLLLYTLHSKSNILILNFNLRENERLL